MENMLRRSHSSTLGKLSSASIHFSDPLSIWMLDLVSFAKLFFRSYGSGNLYPFLVMYQQGTRKRDFKTSLEI